MPQDYGYKQFLKVFKLTFITADIPKGNFESRFEQLFMTNRNDGSLDNLCAAAFREILLKQRNMNKTQSEFFQGILCINSGHFDLSWNQCKYQKLTKSIVID